MQILAQPTEIPKLLMSDIIIGVRILVSPLCMCEFSIVCHFVYLQKKMHITVIV
jgi:hypothetical protein